MKQEERIYAVATSWYMSLAPLLVVCVALMLKVSHLHRAIQEIRETVRG